MIKNVPILDLDMQHPINWLNPLNQGLSECWVMQNGVLRGLVNQVPSTVGGGTPVLGGSAYGRCLTGNGSSYLEVSATPQIAGSVNGSRTIAAIVAPFANGFQCVLGTRANGSVEGLYIGSYVDYSSLAYCYGNTGWYSSVVNVPVSYDGTPRFMAGSFNRRTRIFSQYCHGVGGSASAVITATDCPTIWEVMRDQYGWNFNGHVYIVWLWNRALTLSEMARIEDNYTQLFNLWKDSKRTFAAALSVVEYTAQFGSGTYLATGNQIVGSVNRVGVLSNGSYAIVGQSNSIRVERVASAANGSFSLVGNAMGGEVSRIAVASPGAYAVAGNAIGGEVSRIAVASPGAYTLLGSGLAGGVSRIAVASPGAYTIAGNAIGGQVSRVAVASPGAFSIVASDLAGGVSRQTSVAGGVFTSIGSDLSATVQRIAMHSHGVFTVVGVSGNFPVDVGETPAAVSGTSRAFTVHSAGESVSCDVRSSIWTHEVREPGQAAQGEYQ